MKIKHLLIATILIFVLAFPMFGQPARNVEAKSIKLKNDVYGLMGKPVYESTADSFRTRVWILTQKKNKEMMKTKMGKTMSKMKDNSMAMDKATKEALLAGTHCLIFDVTNIKSRIEVADTSAKVEVVYPSRKTNSVKFKPMMNYFGSGVSLSEKGEYLFTISLNIGGGYNTTQFKYKVK